MAAQESSEDNRDETIDNALTSITLAQLDFQLYLADVQITYRITELVDDCLSSASTVDDEHSKHGPNDLATRHDTMTIG